MNKHISIIISALLCILIPTGRLSSQNTYRLELTHSSDVTALSDEVSDYVPYLKEYLAGVGIPSTKVEGRIIFDIDGGLECGPEGFEFSVNPGVLRITGRPCRGVLRHPAPSAAAPTFCI